MLIRAAFLKIHIERFTNLAVEKKDYGREDITAFIEGESFGFV